MIQPPTEVGGIFEMRLDSSRIFGIGKQLGPKGPGFLPPVKDIISAKSFALIIIKKRGDGSEYLPLSRS